MCKKEDDFTNVNSVLEHLNFSECNSQSLSCNYVSINRIVERKTHQLIL